MYLQCNLVLEIEPVTGFIIHISQYTRKEINRITLFPKSKNVYITMPINTKLIMTYSTPILSIRSYYQIEFTYFTFYYYECICKFPVCINQRLKMHNSNITYKWTTTAKATFTQQAKINLDTLTVTIQLVLALPFYSNY